MKKRRTLPPHIVLPGGKWKFVKKNSKEKVVKTIAKGKTRTIYKKMKRGYHSRKGLLGGSTGSLLISAGAGIVSNFIPDFIGPWTKPAAFGAIGYLMKKPALLNIAAYEAGKALMSGGFGFSNSGGDLL